MERGETQSGNGRDWERGGDNKGEMEMGEMVKGKEGGKGEMIRGRWKWRRW